MPVVAIAIIAVGKRPVLPWAAFGKPVALPVLPICKPRPIVLALTLALISWSVGIGLRGVRRRVRLRLKPLLRLLIRRSVAPQARRNDPIACRNRHRLPCRRPRLLRAAAVGRSARAPAPPAPRQSVGSNARRAANNFPPRPDLLPYGRLSRAGDISRRHDARCRVFLHPAHSIHRIASKDWGPADCSSAARASSCSDLVSF